MTTSDIQVNATPGLLCSPQEGVTAVTLVNTGSHPAYVGGETVTQETGRPLMPDEAADVPVTGPLYACASARRVAVSTVTTADALAGADCLSVRDCAGLAGCQYVQIGTGATAEVRGLAIPDGTLGAGIAGVTCPPFLHYDHSAGTPVTGLEQARTVLRVIPLAGRLAG